MKYGNRYLQLQGYVYFKEYIVKLANEKEEVQNDEPFVPDNYTIQFRNVFFSYEGRGKKCCLMSIW